LYCLSRLIYVTHDHLFSKKKSQKNQKKKKSKKITKNAVTHSISIASCQFLHQNDRHLLAHTPVPPPSPDSSFLALERLKSAGPQHPLLLARIEELTRDNGRLLELVAATGVWV
jgi:hypothetical protein